MKFDGNEGDMVQLFDLQILFTSFLSVSFRALFARASSSAFRTVSLKQQFPHFAKDRRIMSALAFQIVICFDFAYFSLNNTR